jgi:hypothetical protein
MAGGSQGLLALALHNRADKEAKAAQLLKVQTIDFLPPVRRDAAAAKQFIRKTLAQPHTVNPRTIMVDKNLGVPAGCGGASI